MCWNACSRMSRTTWKVMRLFTKIHQPLADGGDTHGNAKLDGNLAQGREVDIALAHNQVHAAARKNGGVQRGKNGNGGKQQGEQHQTAVRLDQL